MTALVSNAILYSPAAQDRALPTEEELWVGAAQSGDLEAFNKIVLKYQGLLFRIAVSIVKDDQAAEDVTQEALIAACCKIRQFRGGSLKAWLARIQVNKCYDQIRRLDRSPVLPEEKSLDDWEESALRFPESLRAQSAEVQYERAELSQSIRHCLSNLPFGSRMVITLVDVEGMSYDEVARTLAVPIGTVKSRLARARQRMASLLRESGVQK